MTRLGMLGVLVLAMIAMLTVPSFAAASTIRAAGGGGGAYTGTANIRLVSPTATLTASTGTITCTSGTGTNPRLASFGNGSVSSSSITTTAATKGTISRLSFGNPLLGNSSNVHDGNTTVFTTFPTTANSTTRCPSTIAALAGGCLGEARPTSPNNTIAAQDVSGGFRVYVTITVNLSCQDGSGNSVLCAYTTGSTPGTAGPISSNVAPYSTGGSTAAVTAVFDSQPVYRSSGSSLCPATGRFTASYQMCTGTVYPGGTCLYVTNP